MTSTQVRSWNAGFFELRPAERQIWIKGRPAKVGARAFDVLQVLVERSERVVTKDELLELAWPGLIVEENNLQVQISALRKLLGPLAIATIPGRGYRFTLPADEASGAESAASVAARRERAQASSGEPAHMHPLASTVLASRANGRELSARSQRVTYPNNLPPPLTRFIGRETEIAAIEALLSRTRILTLIGAGGCGKTRLGLQVAANALEQFPDGVWFLELASLTDPALVLQTLAIALGVKEEPRRPLIQTVTEYCRIPWRQMK